MGMNGPSWKRRHLNVVLAEEAARRSQDETDRLVIIAWNARVSEGGPVQPSPTIEVAPALQLPLPPGALSGLSTNRMDRTGALAPVRQHASVEVGIVALVHALP